MADPNEAGRNARAVFLVDASGNPIGSAAAPAIVLPRPATTFVSATGAAAAGVTLTIPAGGAGVFNYLCWLQIIKFAAALLTAAATPVLVTTTGLAGTPTFAFDAAADVQGSEAEQKYEGAFPVIGSAAATAITVVCPATTGVIWRVNAAYFQQ